MKGVYIPLARASKLLPFSLRPRQLCPGYPEPVCVGFVIAKSGAPDLVGLSVVTCWESFRACVSHWVLVVPVDDPLMVQRAVAQSHGQLMGEDYHDLGQVPGVAQERAHRTLCMRSSARQAWRAAEEGC